MDACLQYRGKTAVTEEGATLDGRYVIRTRLTEKQVDGLTTVRFCKRLGRVEQAFRSMKTVDLKVRPVFHRTADRVRTHVLPYMLACLSNGTCAGDYPRCCSTTRSCLCRDSVSCPATPPPSPGTA